MKVRNLFVLMMVCLGIVPISAHGAEDQPHAASKDMVLVRSVMCESLKNFAPQNQAVVFSIEVGKISCFTSFSAIKAATFCRHKWYRRDKLQITRTLTLKPPNWSTISGIELREVDKGPWRVEIVDNQDRLLETLRFSVTD